ncbi:hypothetical protein M0804_013596 [Polistes exclamans]|nr:hypothetical protein M0804_013596 [Polistes exclamans]
MGTFIQMARDLMSKIIKKCASEPESKSTRHLCGLLSRSSKCITSAAAQVHASPNGAILQLLSVLLGFSAGVALTSAFPVSRKNTTNSSTVGKASQLTTGLKARLCLCVFFSPYIFGATELLTATGLCAPYCLRVECAFDKYHFGISNKPAPAPEKYEVLQKYRPQAEAAETKEITLGRPGDKNDTGANA